MRRKDRLVPEARLEELLRRGQVLHLALNDGGRPYVVPLNYGHEAGRLWVHSAATGRKLRLLRADPRVAFSIVVAQAVAPAAQPCDWTCHYQSLYGEGTAAVVDDPAEKARGLGVVMAHFGVADAEFPAALLARTLVVRIDVETLTGKANPPLE